RAGLEPARTFMSTWPSTMRVCQFRHLGNNDHLSLQRGACQHASEQWSLVQQEMEPGMPKMNHELLE
ncbi:MAG: hypothetical protein U9Q94_06640, partial [Candidatus Bipolaricaulota bacterium]|nr:hypothetical protein [Candidatus Bipolaricaulota bacterium]